MPRHEVELLRAARAVARLQRELRDLRRAIKGKEQELRTERRHLRALAAFSQSPAPDAVPSRLFGGGVALARARVASARATAPAAASTAKLDAE